MTRKLFGIILCAFLLIIAAAGLADQAEDLTGQCTFSASSSKGKYARMTDGDSATWWATKDRKHNWLQITAPEGKTIGAVSLHFRNRPDSYEVQVQQGKDWETVAVGQDGIYHAFHEIPGGAAGIRIYVPSAKKQALGFSEIMIFGEGEIPDHVQRWETSAEGAEVMILAGRWEGETTQQEALKEALGEGKTTVLACLTYIGPEERAEMLNRLWDEGLRIHPLFAGFKDSKKKTLASQYKALGGKDKVKAWLSDVFHQIQPDTVALPDPEDETAHPLTRAAGDAGCEVLNSAAGSAVQHAYILRDGGEKKWVHGETANTQEPDTDAATGEGNGAVPAETAEPAADEKATVIGGGDEAWDPQEHLAPEAVAVLPELNRRGYLDEGEFIHRDDENGLYIYIDSTLRIVIRRLYDPNLSDKRHPLVWFDAEIWCDVAAGELPVTRMANAEKPNSTKMTVAENALQHKAVFATSTDYYIYRIKQPYPTGIEIRNGEVLFDDRFTDPAKVETRFPNYDTLAFFPDGHVESHPCYEWSAQDYLDHGAYDVFSFGPCLVRDGELTERATNSNDAYNPRLGFGMVEPGHYVMILCEGRVKRSKGVQWQRFAEMLQERGCRIAVNLDGGQTAVMAFMGEKLNEVDVNVKNGRETNEILTFGISDQVGSTP